MSNQLDHINNQNLFEELASLIEQSKQRIAVAANSALTLLFWQVGKRINEEILHNERAAYGKQIVETLAVQLENKYGRNFNEKKHPKNDAIFTRIFRFQHFATTGGTIKLVTFH